MGIVLIMVGVLGLLDSFARFALQALGTAGVGVVRAGNIGETRHQRYHAMLSDGCMRRTDASNGGHEGRIST
jgi:hypothetical protein